MEVKFGTPDVAAQIDEYIYLLVEQGELPEPQADELDQWSEIPGHTLKLYCRIKYWKNFLVLKMLKAAAKSHYPVLQ